MTIEYNGPRRASRIDGAAICGRILLVGELNPYGKDPRYALYHEPGLSAGGRLQSKIFGIGARQWYLPMWRANLCDRVWDHAAGAEAARSLVTGEVPWRTIVAFGKKVAGAFVMCPGVILPLEKFGVTVVRRGDMDPITLITLPHPSGANAASWVGDSVARVRAVMASVEPGIPWGELDALAVAVES